MCNICCKPGHKYSHCFQRKKQADKAATKRLSSSPVCFSADVASSKPPSDHSVAHSKPTRVAEASQALMKQLAPPVLSHS